MKSIIGRLLFLETESKETSFSSISSDEYFIGVTSYEFRSLNGNLEFYKIQDSILISVVTGVY